MSDSADVVTMTLTRDEALVPFDFLSEYEDTGVLKQPDSAEEWALSQLVCDLEKQLDEPFRKDYPDLLEEARRKLVRMLQS